ncbi:MAG: hypothetical protein GYB68_03135 [Chloroflexi bacterium]|nr:hypothetical protein [Chloroflexota bacterium]
MLCLAFLITACQPTPTVQAADFGLVEVNRPSERIDLTDRAIVSLGEAQDLMDFKLPSDTPYGYRFEQDVWLFRYTSDARFHNAAMLVWVLRNHNTGQTNHMTLLVSDQLSYQSLMDAPELAGYRSEVAAWPALAMLGEWSYAGQRMGQADWASLVWIEDDLQYHLVSRRLYLGLQDLIIIAESFD